MSLGSSVPIHSRVGDYELIEELGRGSAGVVYRARAPDGEVLAVKIADTSRDAGSTLEAQVRFEWEATLLARLTHPNIVRLRGHGVSGGRFFLAMELVEGAPISRWIRERGRLGVENSASIAKQVAQALAHAHAQGILHRDVKPANIMVRGSGTSLHVKVLDFGLGHLRGEAARREIAGTFLYMAPEQLGILQRAPDARGGIL